jgi:hypothetical protein
MKNIRPINLLLSTLVLSLSFVTLVSATPTISSGINQTFDENQSSEQLQNITITESSDLPVVTAGELRIILPEDISLIFDDERSANILLYGSAVDNGRIDEYPTVTWEDEDRTVVIPVLESFEAGETVVITKLFVEGFYDSSLTSDFITLEVSGTDTVFTDDYYLNIYVSSISDSNKPELPSNVSFVSTVEGLEITWDNPTDRDLMNIEILRGKNTTLISAAYYALFGGGEEYYLDTDVEEGDELNYIFKSSDGLNDSDNSDMYSVVYTLVEEEEEELVCEEGYEEYEAECVEIVETITDCEDEAYGLVDGECVLMEEEEEELVCEEGYEEQSGACIWVEVEVEEEEEATFSDIAGHWGEAYIEALYDAGVVSGNDDGTYAPEATLDRAALAKMLVLAYTDGLVDGLENPFADVSDDDWYVDYAASAAHYGIMTGEGDGSFNGAGEVNRATLIQAVYNASDFSATGMDLPFDDVMESDWFYAAVDAGYSSAVIDGEDETTFNPSGLATRAAAAKVIYNGWYADALVVE